MDYETELTVEEIRSLLLISPEDDISEEINNLHCTEERAVRLKDENNNLRDEVAMLKDRLTIYSECITTLKNMIQQTTELIS